MRSEGNYHDAGFGVSNERNELVERGRREVGGVTITTPGLGSWRARGWLGEYVARVSECRPSGMSSSRGAVVRSEGDHHDAGFGVSTERNELVERGRCEAGRVTITTPGSWCRPSRMSWSRGASRGWRSDHHDAWPWILESARAAWRVSSSSWRCYLILLAPINKTVEQTEQ